MREPSEQENSRDLEVRRYAPVFMSWLKVMTREAKAKAAIDADRIAPPLQEAQTETALRKEATPLAEAVGAAGAPTAA